MTDAKKETTLVRLKELVEALKSAGFVIPEKITSISVTCDLQGVAMLTTTTYMQAEK